MGGAWRDKTRRPLKAERHVFCRNGKGSYGIGLLVEELRRWGMRATFLCETLATSVLGPEDTRSVTDFLLHADQDVQLHLHPTYRHYATFLRSGNGSDPATARQCDRLAAHSRDEQRRLLEEATDYFVAATGYRPSAFRAGGFGADRTTLRVLHELGFVIDSSYNPTMTHYSFPADPPEINLVQKLEGVWELPLTVAKTGKYGLAGLKHFEISAIGSVEMERILLAANEAAMEHVVILFHCFSTVKPKDVYYSEFRPNWIVIRRFQKLVEFLSRQSSRFAVSTFGELGRDLQVLEKNQAAVIPDVGWWNPSVRKCVQAINNAYWF
jgi:hypothetical protein